MAAVPSTRLRAALVAGTALAVAAASLAVVTRLEGGSPAPGDASDQAPTARPGDQATVPSYPVERSPRTFRVASFNVLGASHTRADGKDPDRAPGTVRVRWVLRALERARVDVAGLQELEPVQARAWERVAGREWAAYPRASTTRGDVRQSIVWRRDVWRLVDTRTVASPYFNGNLLDMPLVRLRHRETGRTVSFVNVHNPADTPRFGRQEPWRDEATRRQVAVMERLARRGTPAVITGDMNEREEYYCAMTAVPGVTSASGGRPALDGVCRPPAVSRIDWIFGTAGLRFEDYRHDLSPLVRRASDHPLVSATARLRPGRDR